MPTATRSPRSTPGGSVYRGRKVRPKWGRIVLLGVGLLVVIGLVIGGGAFLYANSLDGNLGRTDPFSELTDGRPPVNAEGSLNILVLGSDSRDGTAYNPDDPSSSTGSVAGERTDAIMILHIPASHDKAYIISIPRDTWVYVPEGPDGLGDTNAKINAAYAWGGVKLTLKTVEGFTGVRINHYLKIDFNGFKKMTDALGGVDVTVNETVTDPRSKRTFTAGVNHLNGDAALDYVRQRYGLPNGDFDRVQRQQIFMRALLAKATDTGTLTNPIKLKNFLDATTESLEADKDFKLTDMAIQFRNLRPGDLSFITTPNVGSQQIDGQSAVVTDKPKALALFAAVKDDKVAEWLKANPANDATKGR